MSSTEHSEIETSSPAVTMEEIEVPSDDEEDDEAAQTL